MEIKTIEQAKQEMDTWCCINSQLYKKALYAYNRLVAEGPVIKKKEVVFEEVKESIFTEKQLYAMNKAEQKVILKDLGVTKIPLLEKNRVKKILELI